MAFFIQKNRKTRINEFSEKLHRRVYILLGFPLKIIQYLENCIEGFVVFGKLMDHKIFSKAILLCNVSSEFHDDFENALTIFDKFSDFL